MNTTCRNQYEVQAANLHAYTLDTASLIDFPDTNLVFDGVTLTPQSGTPYLQNRFISDDGRQWFPILSACAACSLSDRPTLSGPVYAIGYSV